VSARPNLLLIVTDQQRGDCLGLDGHPVLSTPNLDQLGHEGARFRRAYSEAPSCIPARRTLIAGLAPHRHGMVGFQHGVPWEPAATLPGLLTAAGYQTELIGKLHLYPPRKRFGFQRVQLADSAGGGPHNDYGDWLRRQGARPPDPGGHGVDGNGWVGRPSHLPEELSHSTWCVDRALEFLARRDPTAPFFLCVSFIHPHPPLTPPRLYYDRYMQLDLPEPVVGDWVPAFAGPPRGQAVNASRVRLDRETMRRCRAAYYGLINHVDDQLGRLLRRVKPDTFVLFTADHGEMLGDHHRFRKTYAYEGSARVPFLTWAPPAMGLPRSVVCDAPVGLQDVMPTLLEAAGVPPPAGVSGRSVLPLIRGQASEAGGWREALHGEHAGFYEPDDGMHYLVDARTKYVWYSQTGQEQLFDLERDPQERHDLARTADADARLRPWRRRLVAELRSRPEGFADGERLVAGRPHQQLVPPEGAPPEPQEGRA
jgi:arylsulfatase A-like enzyme